MSGFDALATLGLLGVGGVVGAISAVALAARRAQAAVERFAAQLRSFARTSADPEAAALLDAFEACEEEWAGAWSALARLRRLLRIP